MKHVHDVYGEVYCCVLKFMYKVCIMISIRLYLYTNDNVLWRLPYRRIFVYNICHITVSDTVSDGATKRLILNIERAQHDKLSPGI